MKLKTIMTTLLCSLISLPLIGIAAEKSSKRGELSVVVSDIRNNNGVIRIALYNSKQTYEAKDPSGALAYRKTPLSIKKGEAVWKLNDLPYGIYAIKLFHDEDNSGKLKRGFVGRPTEGIGFSMNPKVTTHAPTFDEVKFPVEQPKTNINIKMINP